jgi:hypothetical protein
MLTKKIVYHVRASREGSFKVIRSLSTRSWLRAHLNAFVWGLGGSLDVWITEERPPVA